MVKPVRPWPRADNHLLHDVVHEGDCEKLRHLQNEAFWSGKKITPLWLHLEMAMHNNDLEMGQLLVTYGAKVDEINFKSWVHIQDQEAFRRKCQFLKSCGVQFTPHFIKDTQQQYLSIKKRALSTELGCSKKDIVEDEVIGFDISFLPKEWRRVLNTVQGLGAKDAIIAGDALRDLCLNKPMDGSVNIFVPDCGSERKNKNFVKKVFKEANLFTAHSDGMTVSNGIAEDAEQTTIQKEPCDRWTVLAGKDKTKYDIIFLKGRPKNLLMADWRKFVSQGLFNLCQIGADGSTVIMTDDFKEGVRRREIKITGNSAENTESAHFLRKYFTWKVKDDLQTRKIMESSGKQENIEGKERPLGSLPSPRPPTPPSPPRPPLGRHIPF